MTLPVLHRKEPCIVEKCNWYNGEIVIPNYLAFIRSQDKKLVPLLYFITFIPLGFYWMNKGYIITVHDTWAICSMLALISLGVTYEVKAYWAYRCVIKNIDFSFFNNKRVSKTEIVLSHPIVAGMMVYLVFWLMVREFLSLDPATFGLVCILLLSPLLMYLLFFFFRHGFVKNMATAVVEKARFKSLAVYVCASALPTLILNTLTIGPLYRKPEFDLSRGFLSVDLMIAMLILCAIVLVLNLIFVRLSKRYIFLGRLFLKEIDFSFSTSVPWRSLKEKPLWARLSLLLIVQSLWILLSGLILTLLGCDLWFEAYFLISFLPSIGYYYLHVYWLWHDDFMMACDMCLRWEVINKQENLW